MTFCNEIHLGILNPTMVDKLLIIHEGPKATFYHDILYLLKLNKLIIVYFYSNRNCKTRICKIKKYIFFSLIRINRDSQSWLTLSADRFPAPAIAPTARMTPTAVLTVCTVRPILLIARPTLLVNRRKRLRRQHSDGSMVSRQISRRTVR